MMRTGMATMGLAALLLAGCGRNPGPAATSPQPAEAARQLAVETARRDSLVATARRDSLAAAARSDSLARLAAQQTRADSIRAEVEAGGGMDADVAPSGLSAVDESLLVARVHFAFDRADLTPEFRSLLEQKASLFQRYPGMRVEITGHCDERGSEEYNLALGLRRAAAVQQYLVALGVEHARVSILSLGKERPADPGHDDEAWAANRRAEFSAKSPSL